MITGLTSSQVLESRALHGANILTPPVKESLWHKFLMKFKDPLIIILLVAGVLSMGIACYEYWGLDKPASCFFEPAGIFVAILLATGMAFYFENKADKEFAILNQVNDDEPVTVIRDGATCRVPRRDVVVGDVVIVNTGDEIPADGRLIEATSLSVDESTLTGEPLCDKTADPKHFDSQATYPSDMLLRGTKVIQGHGMMEVTAVGDATEAGKVFVETRIDSSVKTPLSEQLDRLGKLISIAAYTIAALVVVGRVIAWFAADNPGDWVEMMTYLLQTFMIAVALIVVAVPEGLPMAVTLALAYSMRRMLASNNLVRKLHACETMGATTVICTDKTGTLTANQMQVDEAVFFPGVSPDIIEEAIAVNSTAELHYEDGAKPSVIGNPTEGALLLWLDSRDKSYTDIRSRAKVVAELPFTTARKFMATVVRSGVDGKLRLYVKGAPEIVMATCNSIASDITTADVEKILLGFQRRAMRTLGFATCEVSDADKAIQWLESDSRDASLYPLEFIGIVAISDPVREDVPAAVAECRRAGIEIKIVTGDTPATATEIGRQIGILPQGDLPQGSVVTGEAIAQMTDDKLRECCNDLKVIARARPTDKQRLVKALQQRGQVVAVTGDGTNDAPALKAAHVGLSMGDGTSVAKEASDITIIDNSFTSIGRAVLWGRSLYRNIQRFIIFQTTVNVAACLIVLAGAFLGTESPLTVTQMLWVNLIMDTFAAIALASLPPTSDLMSLPPRRRTAFILTPAMGWLIVVSGVVMFGVMTGLLEFLRHYDVTSIPYAILHLGEVTRFASPVDDLTVYEMTVFFTIFVFIQLWNLFNVRAYATGRSAFHFKGCRGFLSIVMLIVVGQLAIVAFGGEMFSVTPLRPLDWLSIVIITSPVILIGEVIRIFHRKP